MVTAILLTILIIDSVVLVAAILAQSGQGAGIAANFGGVSSSADAIIGSRQAGNLLTTITWWSGGIFLGIAFVLQITSGHARTPRSVLDQPFSQQPAAPQPPNAAPALPLEPVTPAPAPSGAPAGGASPSTHTAAPGASAPTATPKH
jgi:preprotein translocase subunit SecG